MIVVKFKGSSRFIFIFSNSEDGNMNEMNRQFAKVEANYRQRGWSWKGWIVESGRPGNVRFQRSARLIEIYHERLNLPHIFV